MTALLNRFEQLTVDQKRYVGLALVALVLLFVYAASRVVDTPMVVIEESKPDDFKSGSLTTDETPEFYRRKDELARKQNDAILAAQKSLEEKVTELGKRMEEGKPGATPAEVAKTDAGQTTPEPTTGEAGKKMIRRGQNQSKISFRSATQAVV
ncbi:MAG: hypothetical protein AB7G93_04600 [Bdellovibrionales bacterium]